MPFLFLFLSILLPTPSVREEECRLMVWDTAGQEEFDAITKAYYRGTVVILFSSLPIKSSAKTFTL